MHTPIRTSLHILLVILLGVLSGCKLSALPTPPPMAVVPVATLTVALTPVPSIVPMLTLTPEQTLIPLTVSQSQAENRGVASFFFYLPDNIFYTYVLTPMANSTYSLAVDIDEGAGLITLWSYHPISVNLQSPDGSLITPISAASDTSIQYGQTNEPFIGVYWVQYRFINQPAGTYTVGINSSLTEEVAVFASQLNFVARRITSDPLSRPYLPGEKVILQVMLGEMELNDGESDMILSDLVVTGTFTLPNGTMQPIDFNDQGLAEDTIAKDGRFTAVVVAPTLVHTSTIDSLRIYYDIYLRAGQWSRQTGGIIDVVPVSRH